MVIWAVYLVLFTVAMLGPGHGVYRHMSVFHFYRGRDSASYMLGAIQWFSVLILVSVVIVAVQDAFGIRTDPPEAENDLVQFFYVSLAPLVEELGFRVLLTGVPLFLLYSGRLSLRYVARCLWRPAALDITDRRKAVLLIVLVGLLFGAAHVAFEESWSEGKFVQASAAGIILGWVYLRYGFVAALIIHWATNYLVFAYAGFVAHASAVTIDEAFSHSFMESLQLLMMAAGCMSVLVLAAGRLRSGRSEL